ncbi:MAG: 6-phosphogluconate dehydrogenase [Pseudomonadota bacterium]|jgi:phosphoglycerate dehydrogenase-like enzyme
MGILVLTHPQPAEPFVEALRAEIPGENLYLDTASADLHADEVEAVLLWRLEPGLLSRYPALQFVAASAAGVDKILGPHLPEQIPLTRTVDPGQNLQIAQYVCATVLRWVRQQGLYDAQQKDRIWRRHAIAEPASVRVGLLGLGESGQVVAQALLALGLQVCAWTRTPRQVDGVDSFDGDAGLRAMLPSCQVLVCLLPLTPATQGIVNAELLRAMPRGAYLINVARGQHVDEAALMAALESGHLAGAALDVQSQEPLPPEHPLWRTPNLLLTPHVASMPTPRVVARQLAENLQRARRGQALLRVVDRSRGY